MDITKAEILAGRLDFVIDSQRQHPNNLVGWVGSLTPDGVVRFYVELLNWGAGQSIPGKILKSRLDYMGMKDPGEKRESVAKDTPLSQDVLLVEDETPTKKKKGKKKKKKKGK